MLDVITREVEKEQGATLANSEETLTQALVAAVTEINCKWCAFKKTKNDSNIPRFFAEACQYKGWSEAIYRKCNGLVKRRTGSYVQWTPDMKPALCTWVFKQKPRALKAGNSLRNPDAVYVVIGKWSTSTMTSWICTLEWHLISRRRGCEQRVSSRRFGYSHNHAEAYGYFASSS